MVRLGGDTRTVFVEHFALNVQDFWPLYNYVNDRLTYSRVANLTWRRDMLGVVKDTLGEHNTTSAANAGWKARADLVSGSRLVRTKGRIAVPMFQNQKAYMPGTKFSVTLEHR